MESSGRIKHRLFKISILLGGIFFRLFNLGSQSLWNDESFTWFRTQLSWIEMIVFIREDGGNLPAFYVVEKLIVDLIGSSEWQLRLLSAVAGIAGVFLAMRLGRTLAGHSGELLAGGFWAFHPMAIWYARDAKPYAWTAFFALAVLILWFELRKKNRMSVAIAVIFLMAIGLLSHYYFFAFAASLVLFSATEIKTRSRFFRTWTLIFFLAALPLFGWLWWMFSFPDVSIGSGWIRSARLLDIPLTFWNLISGFAGKFSLITSLFGAFSLSAAAYGLWKGHPNIPIRKWLILGLFVPISAIWLVSFRRPIYVDRYFIVLLPVAMLLVAVGGDALLSQLSHWNMPIHFRTWIAPGMLLACGMITGWFTLTANVYTRENWRQLANDLKRASQENPEIWFMDPGEIVPFTYYFEGDFLPIWTERVPDDCGRCWLVLRQPFTDTHAFTQSINPEHTPWIPEIPGRCVEISSRDYQTGIRYIEIGCE